MPIKIANELPAHKSLESENIFVMTEDRAMSQDIRPLNILILNLMPTKQVTETQLIRMFADAKKDTAVYLMNTVSYTSRNTDSEYLDRFYKGFSEYKDMFFDGLVVTGAPVEHLEFTQVLYWHELCETVCDPVHGGLYPDLHSLHVSQKEARTFSRGVIYDCH